MTKTLLKVKNTYKICNDSLSKTAWTHVLLYTINSIYDQAVLNVETLYISDGFSTFNKVLIKVVFAYIRSSYWWYKAVKWQIHYILQKRKK